MTVGILGGCGPAAGAWFYTRLIALTDAVRDADHPDVLLCGRASTPDRSRSLLDGGESPAPSLARDAAYLAAGGADFLVLLCHTAHAFFSEIQAAVSVPLLDMVSLSVRYAGETGLRCLGVLCTEGTRAAALYDRAAARMGMTVRYPADHAALHDYIYRILKENGGTGVSGNGGTSGNDSSAALVQAATELAAAGCDGLLLGCTELSLPPAARSLGARFFFCGRWLPVIDPVELLARRTLLLCGKSIKEDGAYAPFSLTCQPAVLQNAGGGDRTGDPRHFL